MYYVMWLHLVRVEDIAPLYGDGGDVEDPRHAAQEHELVHQRVHLGRLHLVM